MWGRLADDLLVSPQATTLFSYIPLPKKMKETRADQIAISGDHPAF
jgi:hypothetical protein